MCRVDITENVSLERSVHGYDSESAYHLGIVGDLDGTDHKVFLEEIDIADHLFLDLVADSERACRAKLAAALLHEVDHSVLDHFGIHFESRDLLGVGKTVEHGICHIAHTALDRQERGGNATGLHLAYEETAHVGAYHLCGLVERSERLDTLVAVAHHHAHDLLGIELEHGGTDAVTGMENRYLTTIGGIERQIDVVKTIESMAQLLVELDDDTLGHLGNCRDIAYTCTDNDCTVVLDVADLDDSYIYVTDKTLAEFLSCLREMKIIVVGIMTIDALTQIRVILIGCTATDSIGTGKHSVTLVGG